MTLAKTLAEEETALVKSAQEDFKQKIREMDPSNHESLTLSKLDPAERDLVKMILA